MCGHTLRFHWFIICHFTFFTPKFTLCNFERVIGLELIIKKLVPNVKVKIYTKFKRNQNANYTRHTLAAIFNKLYTKIKKKVTNLNVFWITVKVLLHIHTHTHHRLYFRYVGGKCKTKINGNAIANLKIPQQFLNNNNVCVCCCRVSFVSKKNNQYQFFEYI